MSVSTEVRAGVAVLTILLDGQRLGGADMPTRRRPDAPQTEPATADDWTSATAREDIAKHASDGVAQVLIVDDDPGLREALRELLADAGIMVLEEAANGAEGVGLARTLAPDVVIMDNRMPVMGRIEATRQILDSLPTAYVILLTAYEDPAIFRRASEAGAHRYLVKGCPPEQIIDAVRGAIELRTGDSS